MVNLIGVTTLWRPAYTAASKEYLRIIQIILWCRISIALAILSDQWSENITAATSSFCPPHVNIAGATAHLAPALSDVPNVSKQLLQD